MKFFLVSVIFMKLPLCNFWYAVLGTIAPSPKFGTDILLLLISLLKPLRNVIKIFWFSTGLSYTGSYRRFLLSKEFDVWIQVNNLKEYYIKYSKQNNGKKKEKHQKFQNQTNQHKSHKTKTLPRSQYKK